MKQIAGAMRRSDSRAHRHAAWWAFALHRVSGLALAVFLPLHFWALGQALHGDAALDGFLRFADRPLFKLAEWGLVVLLALHMTGGVRLLLIEFGPWSGLRKDWIAGAAGVAALAGVAFALALFA
jgi:succinate dehydrogenase subunit D